jgi:hypothetical protein
MDTAPGGETPQYVQPSFNASFADNSEHRYESIQTVTNPTETQSGQLKGKKECASGDS